MSAGVGWRWFVSVGVGWCCLVLAGVSRCRLMLGGVCGGCWGLMVVLGVGVSELMLVIVGE